jgi:hypothetical protein
MDWAHILAYVTGTVEQELLARNEYWAFGSRDRRRLWRREGDRRRSRATRSISGRRFRTRRASGSILKSDLQAGTGWRALREGIPATSPITGELITHVRNTSPEEGSALIGIFSPARPLRPRPHDGRSGLRRGWER